MLFTEAQLHASNPMAALDEATYLSDAESIIRPQTIPVRENTRIGANVVRFDDIHRLAESNGASYLDAMVAVAEASGIDPSTLKVAVDEAEIICNPDVVFALPEASVVVAPLSENSLASKYVNECVSQWLDLTESSGEEAADGALIEALVNDSYLEQYVNEADKADAKEDGPGIGQRISNAVQGAKDHFSKFGSDLVASRTYARNEKDFGGGIGKQAKAALGHAGEVLKNNPKTTAGLVVAGGLGAAAVAKGLSKAKSMLDEARNKPKSWIGQKIAALRAVYKNWMDKAANAQGGVGAKIKQAAAKLMQIIDALMERMQKAAG